MNNVAFSKASYLSCVVEHRAQNRNQTHLFGEMRNAKEGFQLLQRDYNSSSSHESNKSSLWKEINNKSKSAEATDIPMYYVFWFIF